MLKEGMNCLLQRGCQSVNVVSWKDTSKERTDDALILAVARHDFGPPGPPSGDWLYLSPVFQAAEPPTLVSQSMDRYILLDGNGDRFQPCGYDN